MARVAPEVHFSSAGRGHDDGARIQVSRTILHFFRAKAKALACLFLIAFTAGRITGTVVNVLNSVSLDLYGDLPIPVQVLDCFLRPLLGGLSFMPFILRYNGSGLHIFSLVGWFVLVLCSSVLELIWIVDPPRLSSLFPALIFLCWSSRVGLVLVTFLKLDALGWHRTGWVCLLAWTGWVLARLGVTIMIDIEMAGNAKYFFAWILLHACQGLISAVNGFVLLYESHAKQRLLNKMTDKKLAQTASRGVLFLRLGAFLTLLDAVYLPLVETYGYSDSENEILLSPALFLTFDNSMVLVSILILGGLIGPRDTLDQIEVMEELEHIARTQGRRIAFPGKLNRHSPHCIVSFPGKYSSET